jgi:NAD(P)H-hydrate epimerase
MNAGAALRLAGLLTETAAAHHQAYSHTNGEDVEWALWYAGYLHDRLPAITGKPMTKSELVYLLVGAERARSAAQVADWPAFYAEFILRDDRPV